MAHSNSNIGKWGGAFSLLHPLCNQSGGKAIDSVNLRDSGGKQELKNRFWTPKGKTKLLPTIQLGKWNCIQSTGTLKSVLPIKYTQSSICNIVCKVLLKAIREQ